MYLEWYYIKIAGITCVYYISTYTVSQFLEIIQDYANGKAEWTKLCGTCKASEFLSGLEEANCEWFS